MTWVWRESSHGANHDLMYACSEDQGKTWYNNRREKLAECPSVESPGIRGVEIGRQYGLMNTHGQAIDRQGRVHVVMWHCTDKSLREAGSRPGQHRWGPAEPRRYHHHRSDTTGRWHHAQLPGAVGTRPKVFVDRDDNVFAILSTPESEETHRIGPLVLMAAAPETR